MNSEHQHFYITPAILPQPDSTDTEWIQRVTMLASVGEELAKHIYLYLKAAAPVLVTEDTLLFHLLAGLGLTLRGVTATGERQLAKAGKEPLDATEEQARTIRDELAKPNLPPDLREALLTILAHNLNAEKQRPSAEDSDWPAGGFVIGEDGT